MSFRVVTKNSVTVSASPYRLLHREREVTWANDFLDAQRLRQLSLRSLRAYAFDLLHAARWFQTKRHSLARLNQSLLLQYVHDQLQHSLFGSRLRPRSPPVEDHYYPVPAAAAPGDRSPFR